MAAIGRRLASLSVIVAMWGAHAAFAQASYPCVNDAPDPYQRGTSFAPLPDGRAWGSTAGVSVGPDGTIWAYDRCGANSCAGSPLDPVIAFAPDGKVIRHFGGGLFQMPHGLTVDDAGNIWVTCEPEEPILPGVIDVLGADFIMFASDYPHWDGEWPESTKHLRTRGDISEEAREKIGGLNAQRFYALN